MIGRIKPNISLYVYTTKCQLDSNIGKISAGQLVEVHTDERHKAPFMYLKVFDGPLKGAWAWGFNSVVKVNPLELLALQADD